MKITRDNLSWGEQREIDNGTAKCDLCGTNPAVCFGFDPDGQDEEHDGFCLACDECCGHVCPAMNACKDEDCSNGCVPVSELVSEAK